MTTRIPAKHAPFDAACVVDNAAFVIGAEAGNVKNVGIQLKDANYRDISRMAGLQAYLSDNPTGDNVIATAPSGTVVIGTDGVLIDQDATAAKKRFTLISEADGDIDINITEAGAKTLYLVLIMPSGHLVVSPAITFV